MNYKLVIKNHIPLIISLLLISTVLQAQDERKFIRKGTNLYDKGEFLDAEIEYRKALDKKHDSYEGKFNVAASQYRQEKFKESVSDLQNLANQTDDPAKLHQIYHNLGNSYLGMTQIDQQNAGKYLDLSIEAYKKALKNNPLDNETRYNLLAAMKLKQQQQEQEQNQEQKQDQQEQEQEQEQNQEQQQQEQINKENAERILQALEQDEKDLQEKMQMRKQAQPVKIDKNW